MRVPPGENGLTAGSQNRGACCGVLFPALYGSSFAEHGASFSMAHAAVADIANCVAQLWGCIWYAEQSNAGACSAWMKAPSAVEKKFWQ